MTGPKEIIKKIIGRDIESKDAAPPVKRAAVPAPKPTPKTTTGWKPMK